MKFDITNNIEFEAQEPASSAAWIEDTVEVYWEKFTITVKNVKNRKEAKEVFAQFGVEYYDTF